MYLGLGDQQVTITGTALAQPILSCLPSTWDTMLRSEQFSAFNDLK
jgi:hypothetical protein